MARSLEVRLIEYLSDYPEGLLFREISKGMIDFTGSSMELIEAALIVIREGLIVEVRSSSDTPLYKLTKKGFRGIKTISR